MSKFEIENFDPSPDEELICGICRMVFNSPVECPCRHVFCKNCIETWIGNKRTCPNCRKPVRQEKLTPVIPILQNMINKLTLRCCNHEAGCEVKVMLEAYETHLESCSYEMIGCSNPNCSERRLRKDLEKHEKKECRHRLVKCRRDCQLELPRSNIRTHNCVQELKKRLAEAESVKGQLNQLQRQLQKLNREKDALVKQVQDMSGRGWSSIRDLFFLPPLQSYDDSLSPTVSETSSYLTDILGNDDSSNEFMNYSSDWSDSDSQSEHPAESTVISSPQPYLPPTPPLTSRSQTDNLELEAERLLHSVADMQNSFYVALNPDAAAEPPDSPDAVIEPPDSPNVDQIQNESLLAIRMYSRTPPPEGLINTEPEFPPEMEQVLAASNQSSSDNTATNQSSALWPVTLGGTVMVSLQYLPSENNLAEGMLQVDVQHNASSSRKASDPNLLLDWANINTPQFRVEDRSVEPASLEPVSENNHQEENENYITDCDNYRSFSCDNQSVWVDGAKVLSSRNGENGKSDKLERKKKKSTKCAEKDSAGSKNGKVKNSKCVYDFIQNSDEDSDEKDFLHDLDQPSTSSGQGLNRFTRNRKASLTERQESSSSDSSGIERRKKLKLGFPFRLQSDSSSEEDEKESNRRTNVDKKYTGKKPKVFSATKRKKRSAAATPSATMTSSSRAPEFVRETSATCSSKNGNKFSRAANSMKFLKLNYNKQPEREGSEPLSFNNYFREISSQLLTTFSCLDNPRAEAEMADTDGDEDELAENGHSRFSSIRSPRRINTASDSWKLFGVNKNGNERNSRSFTKTSTDDEDYMDVASEENDAGLVANVDTVTSKRDKGLFGRREGEEASEIITHPARWKKKSYDQQHVAQFESRSIELQSENNTVAASAQPRSSTRVRRNAATRALKLIQSRPSSDRLYADDECDPEWVPVKDMVTRDDDISEEWDSDDCSGDEVELSYYDLLLK